METVDKVLTLAIILAPAGLAFWRAWQSDKAAKTSEEKAAAQKEMLEAVMLGAQLYKQKNPEHAEALSTEIQNVAIQKEVEDKLNPIYKKTTQNIQIPKLVILFILFFGLTGCVNPSIHRAALALQTDLDRLNQATVPDPAYNDPKSDDYDPKAPEKVKELQKRCLATVNAIEEASR